MAPMTAGSGTGLRHGAVMALGSAAGFVLGGWPSAVLGAAAALAAVLRPRLAALAAAVLLAGAAVATLVEEPLSTQAIPTFGADRGRAHELGRAAAVLTVVAVTWGLVRERAPRPAGRPGRQRPPLPDVFVPLVVVGMTAAATAVLAVTGDRLWADAAPAVAVAGLAVAALAAGFRHVVTLRDPRRARRRESVNVGAGSNRDGPP